MNKWAKLLIISLIGFFLLGGIGSYGILEATGEEVVARGDASEEISFKGDWDQFYDIYAEDQSIEISFFCNVPQQRRIVNPITSQRICHKSEPTVKSEIVDSLEVAGSQPIISVR